MKQFGALAAAVLVQACNTTRTHESLNVPVDSSLQVACKALINAMGDKMLSRECRYLAAGMLAIPNKETMPCLVEAIDDDRVFDEQAHPASRSFAAEGVVVTVGAKCKDILAGMIELPARGRYRIDDWKLWWRKHRIKTLSEIREEAKGETCRCQ